MVKFTVPAMAWTSPRTGKERLVIDCKYVEGRSPNWTRKNRYQLWKQHVQACAVEAGIELPLRPQKTLPFYIITTTYFHSGVHADVSNVWEGVTDALCYVSPQEQALGVKRGSDKYVGGLFFAPQYDKEHPRVEVTLLTKEEFDGAVIDYHVAVCEWVM